MVWSKSGYSKRKQPSFSDSYKCAHVRLFTVFLCEEVLGLYVKAQKAGKGLCVY